MRKTDDKTTGDNDGEQALLEELFSSADDSAIIDIDESYGNTIRALITYTVAVGGMATFYRGSSGDYIGCSIRLGKRKRSITFSGDDVDLRILTDFTDGIKRLWLHRFQLANATKLDADATKSKKAKK